MFFSIILPIYNVEKYLSECIESILKQTFTDYEVILVNDGSTDQSGAICDEYVAKNPQFQVIHKSNGGSADTRNVGIACAVGQYVICIDSDDYIIPNSFLSDIHQCATSNEADIIQYWFQKFTDGQAVNIPASTPLTTLVPLKKEDEILSALVQKDTFTATVWSKAIRREFLIRTGVEFKVGLTGEDNDWYLNLLVNNPCKIAVLAQTCIAYRQRKNSTSRVNKLKNLTDYVDVMEEYVGKISNAPVTDLKKNALLGAMAKYYVNLLILYAGAVDPHKSEFKERIKKLNWLLNFSLGRRAKFVHISYRFAGFNITILLLKIIGALKGH